ncbi:hypothetical protein D3C87_1606320 [compost metagenome]
MSLYSRQISFAAGSFLMLLLQYRKSRGLPLLSTLSISYNVLLERVFYWRHKCKYQQETSLLLHQYIFQTTVVIKVKNQLQYYRNVHGLI